MTTTKDFFALAEEDGSVPDGNYHLKVVSAEVGEWDDGRARVDVNTEVMSGEYVGNYGPRLTWSIDGYEGVTGDGESFSIPAQRQRQQMASQALAIMGAYSLTLTTPDQFDGVMLDEIAKAVVGKEFFASVKKDKGGYSRVRRVFALSNPPKGMAVGGGGFSVNFG